MRIRDAQLRSTLEQQRVPTVDDHQLLRLLAGAGDGAQDAENLLQQLAQPGMTRQQQLDIIRDGVDADELADLADLLDQGTHVFTPQGRNFLEALLGRAPLQEGGPALQVDGAGNVSGTVAAGDRVEVLNLSTATIRGARVTDAVEVARADTWGAFQGSIKHAAVGDTLRVQTRNAQGRVTSWLNVRVQQAGGFDPRAAYVDAGRLSSRTTAEGQLVLEHRTRLPVTEPGAAVRFTNTRTGDTVDARADEHGRLPTLTLPALAGDSISVAVSDGAGNTDLSLVAATLTAPAVDDGSDVADPAPLDKDAWVRAQRSNAPVFAGAPSFEQVAQGQIGNCYVPAACAAVAAADPDAIRDIVEDHGNGRATVTFHPNGGPAVRITVDADLYGDASRPRYGRGVATDGGPAPTWFPLVEKAWAAYRGSYEIVGRGGSVGQMMSDLTGRPNTEHWLNTLPADDAWKALQAGVAGGRAMAAGTYGTQEAARYTGSGVYANHAYSVLGAEEKDGQRLVVLRNPWGTGEPGNDGRNDGVFRLPLDRFMQLFQVLNAC